MNTVTLKNIMIGYLILNILLTTLVIIDSIFILKIILFHNPYYKYYGKFGITLMVLSFVFLILGIFKSKQSKLLIILPIICLVLEFISMILHVGSIFI